MYLNSPAPRLGNSAASRGRKGVPETSTKDGHIDSTDYLTTGSLLRGDRAICLPVSAGLPSAGGGLSDSIRMTTPSPHPITPENRFRAAGLRSQIPKLAELRKSSPSRISQTAPTPPQHTSSASSHLLKNRELLKTVSIASISNSTATISESSSRSNSIVLMNKKTSTTGIISSSRSSPPAATTTRSRQTLGYPSSLAKGESSRKSLSKRDSSFFLLSSKPFTDAEALQYKLLNSKPGRNISNSVETMDDGGGRSRVCQWGEEDDIESLSERVGSVSSNDLFSTGNREKARAYSMETTGSGWVKVMFVFSFFSLFPVYFEWRV
ncbi:hypothetical protein BDR26DRAFT_858444 [Obelidium mucronatum]|nr:hypothetical protein BDR26DRAFT_858444 [Obelidium mucronatum]